MSGFANFGIGLSAAMDGFGNGLQIGRAIRGLRDEKQIKDVTKDGIAEAQQERQGQINGMIQTQPLPGGAQSFKVGEQSYTNRAEAEKAAERFVGSTMDYFNKTVAPRIRETYVTQGNMEMAEKWDKYAQNQATQKGMRSYVQALRSRAMGDDEGALKHMVEAYNDRDYYGDGYKVSGYEPIKEGDKVVGYRGTFEGPDGKTSTQDFKKGDLSALVQMGIGMLSPDQAFATTMAQQQAADSARAKSAAERLEQNNKVAGAIATDNNQSRNRITEKGADFQYDTQLQGQRDAASMDRTITGIQMNTAASAQRRGAELQAEEDQLRGLGMSNDEVRATMARRIGGSSGTTADPGAAAWDSEMRNNPLFSQLSDEERQEAVTRGIQGRRAATQAAAAAGQTSGTIPRPAGVAGVILIDPATGKEIHR